MSLSDILLSYIYLILFCTAGIAIYGIVSKSNLIKKIIALTIFGDIVNTLIILIGYRLVPKPLPPILPSLNPDEALYNLFVKSSVDPLPQALVITAIVINVAVVAFLVFLVVRIYASYGTIEYEDLIKRDRGETI